MKVQAAGFDRQIMILSARSVAILYLLCRQFVISRDQIEYVGNLFPLRQRNTSTIAAVTALRGRRPLLECTGCNGSLLVRGVGSSLRCGEKRWTKSTC